MDDKSDLAERLAAIEARVEKLEASDATGVAPD